MGIGPYPGKDRSNRDITVHRLRRIQGIRTGPRSSSGDLPNSPVYPTTSIRASGTNQPIRQKQSFRHNRQSTGPRTSLDAGVHDSYRPTAHRSGCPSADQARGGSHTELPVLLWTWHVRVGCRTHQRPPGFALHSHHRRLPVCVQDHAERIHLTRCSHWKPTGSTASCLPSHSCSDPPKGRIPIVIAFGFGL